MKNLLFFFFFMISTKVQAVPVIKAACNLFDEKGVMIKSFPGIFCEYLETGYRVTFWKDKLALIDPHENIVWEHPGFYHHRIAFDLPKKEIVTLSDSVHDFLGCTTRFDTILILDINTGKIKKTVDFYDLFKNKEINISHDYTYIAKMSARARPLFMCDTTHVNSVSQIPDNPYAKINKAFSKGNWVVNASFTGNILVFDREFNKVLWQATVPLDLPFTHDVQVTDEGKILLYVNNYLKPGQGRRIVTAIVEFDPALPNKKNLKVVELKVDGKNTFQDITGGIQYLADGRKLVSVFTPKAGYQAAIMDKNWNILMKFSPVPTPNKKFGQNFQEAKLIELNDFFSKYQGPF